MALIGQSTLLVEPLSTLPNNYEPSSNPRHPPSVGAAVLIVFATLVAFATRYKKCPSDRILVVYGKVASGRSAHCLHGGAAFIWPIIQDYQFLDLTPMPIDINLQGALSKQNIRVNTPSTFTVGVATEPGVMENAAERLLG